VFNPVDAEGLEGLNPVDAFNPVDAEGLEEEPEESEPKVKENDA